MWRIKAATILIKSFFWGFVEGHSESKQIAASDDRQFWAEMKNYAARRQESIVDDLDGSQ